MTEKIFQYRWIIGFLLLIFCVIFKIHGSSIGMYVEFCGHSELSDIIFGQYRPIRSDEWLVFTPFAFSQYFNDFSIISEIVRGTATNMFIVYGQAVWDIAMIYRPAQIGYLFLDQGSGLAFFWMGRLIVLFLISFEFARKIIQVNKKLSVLYAIMIAFSPLAQWWWSVNSIAEILAAGQGMVVCWKFYLENAEISRRFLFGVAFLWCVGVFIFGIYPAWQISFGYVFLACLLAISFEKATLKILWRDKIFWVVGFAVMIAPILHVLYISQEMIQLQMNTEYPGRRLTTCGDLPLYVHLTDLICPILPFKDIQEFPGNCGMATFYSMAPLGFIAAYLAKLQSKTFDKMNCFLMALIVFFAIFQTIEFPNFLAKITFMGNVTGLRLKTAIDLAQLILLFRSLKFITDFISPLKRLTIAIIISLVSAFAIYYYLPEDFSIETTIFIMLFSTIAIILFLTPLNKIRVAILALMMFIIGITVNPINSGVDVIYKMPVGQKISEIVQSEISSGQKNSLWLVVDDIGFNDFPIMFGAPTINSVNIYPALDRWKKLDPDGKDFKIYNRYAHIRVNLQNEPTKFIFTGDDNFGLDLNPEDLKKLEIKYILSRREDLENFSTPNTTITEIFKDSPIVIYRVDYRD